MQRSLLPVPGYAVAASQAPPSQCILAEHSYTVPRLYAVSRADWLGVKSGSVSGSTRRRPQRTTDGVERVASGGVGVGWGDRGNANQCPWSGSDQAVMVEPSIVGAGRSYIEWHQ